MTREEFLKHYNDGELHWYGQNYFFDYELCLNQGIRSQFTKGKRTCLPYGVTQTTKNGKWYVFDSSYEERSGFSNYIEAEFEPDEEEKAYDYLYNKMKPEPKTEDTRTPEQIEEDWFYAMYPDARPKD